MSIEFVVIGLPRSGTTWMANWLTTDTTLCIHDPFTHLMPEQLDSHPATKKLGISCTGAYALKWFESLDCPVIVIERDTEEVNKGLAGIGMPPTPDWTLDAYKKAKGKRYRFEDIWNEDKAREMWAFLLPRIPFDTDRYRMLCEMQIQPHMGKWKPDMEIIETLIKRGELCPG